MLSRSSYSAAHLSSLIVLAVVTFPNCLAFAEEQRSENKVAQNDNWETLSDGSLGMATQYHGVGGEPIAAYLRKPPGDGPFPVVVMIHGGGQSEKGTHSLGRMRGAPTANFLAQGWAIYSIDFRPRAEFAPIEWEDAGLALETIKKLPFIDKTRVAMIGGSHGAHNTIRIAARYDLTCAIACAPPAINLEEVAKAKATGYKLSPALERVLARGNPTPGPTIFSEADKIRCPLLLVSGQNDWSSPPSVIEAYVKVLKQAEKEVETFLPKNGPHGFYFGSPAIPETDEAAGKAVAFIAKHFQTPVKETTSVPAPRSSGSRPNRPTAPDSDRIARVFARLDVNQDGKVDSQEADNPRGVRLLQTFDKNRDGVVTRAEATTMEPTAK
ncbi:alpha/beta fold hydrolase [Blastopirellula sp. JC732]|uniref:Alpha/beta fold hydrolase n=1 Tax=Blastopirellula sediminis TaxID=2894196 RepID=A0A9X1MJE4_9BACT|nr:prolyl oligopeptidase family serine peptidase [Blastopirellula sediminis]MCC9609314.1 alpha/beta fold hydrolase [Blastopirellula sediminis]MCC9627909.1 alpha/beta fold hydrolase [Blastopirellula sediminis]